MHYVFVCRFIDLVMLMITLLQVVEPVGQILINTILSLMCLLLSEADEISAVE